MNRRFSIALLLVLAGPVMGWSAKEHIQMTRMAAERLLADPTTPPAMRDWLREILPEHLDEEAERQYWMTALVGFDLEKTGGGVLWWAVVPDERAKRGPREATRPPFNQHERLMHFIDLELFLTGSQQRAYRHDLSGKPPLENIPRDWHDARFVQAGYLPFAVDHAFGELVKSLKDNRRKPTTAPTTHPADYSSEDSSMKWAGYLAHYVQDSTQPHHGTKDFKSASYFKNRRTAPDVHAEIEFRLGDDETRDFPELRARYWEHFTRALNDRADPIDTDDPWLATMQTVMRSYDALPLIGLAASAAVVAGNGSDPDTLDTTRFFEFSGRVGDRELTVLQLKAEQCAWAVQRTQRVWRQAWEASRR